MNDHSTPKPESNQYDVEHPENLNLPKFNSSSEKREGAKLSAIENMNDQDEKVKPEDSNRSKMPETDLGNHPDDDEKESERIIRR
ncbi:hypothetical protein [Pedobacter sp. JCM 36344]|uniref:hypothetical protein n=1 Tax=Pedobacter sp. JCM 36344 TaxID=3374280 RepID=UPI00397841D8